MASSELKTINEWADFWCYDIGVNVIPANTRKKETFESWKEWQDGPIPKELHEEWKESGAYNNGIAIILGKVWHNPHKGGLFLVGIDLDNQKAIEEICSRNGSTISLSKLSEWTLVEQHLDDPSKAHVLLYGRKPFPKKGSDNHLEISGKLDNNEIPAIEVKGLGSHGILFVSPSVHQNGTPYQIIGTQEPAIADNFVNHIDNICKKYSIPYLEAADNGNGKALLPIQNLFKAGFTIVEGHNRHEALMRVMESLSVRNSRIFSIEEIKSLAQQWNQKHCSPPLDDREFEKQWVCATDYIVKKTKDQEQGKEEEKDDNGNAEKDKPRKKQHFVQKYSETGLLAEAVIVGGIPYFAVAKVNSGNVALEESIPIDDRSEYKPYEQSAYLNKPYSFKSKEDFESCIEKARRETLDTLYIKVKSIWLKYIDADDFHISICAADTIFTYYQDKIGLTHYLFFVGNNSSGKSNNLTVFHFLAYRNFTSTDITAANIYQFLGSGEEGLGTLCEDEADRIDEDRQKMAIYKNGNITGRPVARTDTSFGRKQLKLNTYCWKAFAAERFPDPTKAKGFNQRVIELQCSFGDPEQDIAEVANPAGAEEFQHLLDELNEMRNLLLAYRLLHFNEKIPDIKLNIKGREKQLFKPVLRVFQNTKTLGELLPVVSKYVAQKREANFSTLHAFLYRSVRDIIKDQGKTDLTSRFIWDYIKVNLQGEDIHGKPLSYETSEFGVITQKEITQTLEHIFGARPKKVNGIRTLVFDLTKLQRLGKVYDLETEIKVIRLGEGENLGSDRSDRSDVGLDKHITASSNEHKEISDVKISEHKDSTDNGPVDSPHVSEATHPTLTLYRCYHNDCDFQTDDEREYRRHWVQKHTGIPVLYPTKAELKKYGLKAQGKEWEV